MKLEIENKLAPKPGPPVTLGLRPGPDLSVLLVVIGHGQIENQLLSFHTDGSVKRFGSIRKEYGFDLDKDGRLNIKDR